MNCATSAPSDSHRRRASASGLRPTTSRRGSGANDTSKSNRQNIGSSFGQGLCSFLFINHLKNFIKMKKHSTAKPIPCFKRWSRTNYAVFASLHRQVTIGVLAVGMSILLLTTETAAAQQADTSGVSRVMRIEPVGVTGTRLSPSRSIQSPKRPFSIGVQRLPRRSRRWKTPFASALRSTFASVAARACRQTSRSAEDRPTKP